METREIPFERQQFEEGKCFLCGVNSNLTEEDVFPRWLQRRFNLVNERLTLPNKTSIFYRQLKIPCCAECNNEYLSQLENEIKFAFDNDIETVRQLPELRLFQWVVKIYYGIMYRELTLSTDRSRPNSPKLMTPELLQGFDFLHGCLQSVREHMEFPNGLPWSFVIFHLHKDPYLSKFDYHDNPELGVFSIRLDDIALLACFHDRGLVAAWYQDTIAKLQNILVHPIQYYEMIARFSYRAALTRVPETFISIQAEDGDQNIIVVPPLTGGVLDYSFPEKPELLVRLLELHLKKFNDLEFTRDIIQRDDGAIWTSIWDENDQVVARNEEGFPVDNNAQEKQNLST
ncbi:MAG: hypothetical protein AAF485_22730 [Chloroflexota bacterium]